MSFLANSFWELSTFVFFSQHLYFKKGAWNMKTFSLSSFSKRAILGIYCLLRISLLVLICYLLDIEDDIFPIRRRMSTLSQNWKCKNSFYFKFCKMSESIWINDLLTHAGNLNICETFKTFQTHLRFRSILKMKVNWKFIFSSINSLMRVKRGGPVLSV